MTRAFRWILAALGIALVSIAVLILAAGLFPGDPGRFYMIAAILGLSAAVLVRLMPGVPQLVAHRYEIRNALATPLEIWVEPWCHPYYVPQGSTLQLDFIASSEWPLETEFTEDRLIVWPNSNRAPTAT